jgi:hypothetical protein
MSSPSDDPKATGRDDAGEPAPEAAPRKPGPPPEGAAIGIAIGFLATVSLAALGFLVAFTLFAFIATYAVVKAVTDQGAANPVTVLVGVVLLVTTFAVLLAVGMGMLGRSLSPKRKRGIHRDHRSRRRRTRVMRSAPSTPVSSDSTGSSSTV